MVPELRSSQKFHLEVNAGLNAAFRMRYAQQGYREIGKAMDFTENVRTRLIGNMILGRKQSRAMKTPNTM